MIGEEGRPHKSLMVVEEPCCPSLTFLVPGLSPEMQGPLKRLKSDTYVEMLTVSLCFKPGHRGDGQPVGEDGV